MQVGIRYGVIDIPTDAHETQEGGRTADGVMSVADSSAMPPSPYVKAYAVAATRNPYAHKSLSSLSTKTTQSQPRANVGGKRATQDDPNALWADKYAPDSIRDILGNGECVN